MNQTRFLFVYPLPKQLGFVFSNNDIPFINRFGFKFEFTLKTTVRFLNGIDSKNKPIVNVIILFGRQLFHNIGGIQNPCCLPGVG